MTAALRALPGVALCAALGAAATAFALRLTPYTELLVTSVATVSSEAAVETVGLYGLGMRRAAADLALIRMIIYYGTGEDEEAHLLGFGDHEGHHHSGGRHAQLLERARAVLGADPAFTYAALWASGALAFNLDRPDEALELLETALARDPRNFQLRSYVGAIGFHKKGEPRKVIEVLEPVLAYPDCPGMIKHLMAVLYRKVGDRARSRALYEQLLSHPDYRIWAEQALRERR